MARHSTQKPQNSQNNTGFLRGFREFCVDRRGWDPAAPFDNFVFVSTPVQSTADARSYAHAAVPQINKRFA